MSFSPLSRPAAEFPALVARFTEFREMVARQPGSASISTGLDMWAGFMACALEAAARAPETDRFLAWAWGARLVSIVGDARQALAAASIAAHETDIPLSRVAEPAAQPAARPARHRTSRPYGLRR